jgi:hypothetical protein
LTIYKRAKKFFFDTTRDNNGTLSKDEIKDGFKGFFKMGGVDPNEFVVDVAANNKIKKLDADKDGLISKSECHCYVKAFSLFVTHNHLYYIIHIFEGEFIEGVKRNKNLGENLFFM